MSHPLYDVTAFEQVGAYTLRVHFDDGTEQLVDFEPMLYGETYEPLRDRSFFSQVRLDAEIRTLVWPNGADFDPYVLHEWPRVVDQLSNRLRTTNLYPA
jgi:hypothetical protein